MPPTENRVRVARLNLTMVSDDFIRRHVLRDAYAAPAGERILYQASWPADATIAWAMLEQPEQHWHAVIMQAISAMREIADHPHILPHDAVHLAVADALENTNPLTPGIPGHVQFAAHAAAEMPERVQPHIDALTALLSDPPGRHLRVGIASALFDDVPVGSEPDIHFDPAPFAPPAPAKKEE